MVKSVNYMLITSLDDVSIQETLDAIFFLSFFHAV